MHRNWNAICEVKNHWLRMLAATCQDPLLLKSLQDGFPELFQSECEELKVPVSALIHELEKTEFGFWNEVLPKFDIPHIHWSDHEGAVCNEVPEELYGMLESLPFDKDGGYSLADHISNPVVVFWQGEEFYAVDAIEPYNDEPNLLYLVPTNFIDLSC